MQTFGPSNTVFFQQTSVAPQVRTFDTFFINCPVVGSSAVYIRWQPIKGADVGWYNIYRSYVGFSATEADLVDLDGKVLQLKVNGYARSVMFNGTEPVADQIRSISTLEAYPSEMTPGEIIVRVANPTNTSAIEIVGGDALPFLGLTARVITLGSESVLLDTVPAAETDDTYLEFEDKDGRFQDTYALSTLDTYGRESIKTMFLSPTTAVGKLCTIEGFVSNLQGSRVPDTSLCAQLIDLPQHINSAYITRDIVKVLSGADGKFSISLLQGALVKISIPAIGFTRYIRVPEEPYKLVANLFNSPDFRISP